MPTAANSLVPSGLGAPALAAGGSAIFGDDVSTARMKARGRAALGTDRLIGGDFSARALDSCR